MVDLKIQLPKGFLEEEVRCEYTVTHEMKKIWAVMLDLLQEFDRVCKKHNLKYQVNGGTLLGAVRHKGFIPWDDDLDVQMFREDYDKLCEIGPSEFQHPYFFQSKYTDPGMGTFFAKLRNSNTTAFSEEERNGVTEYNKGIFIDIMPLDNIPDDAIERERFFKEILEKRLQVIKKGRTFGIFSETNKPVDRIIKKCLFHLFSYRRKTKIQEFLQVFREYEQLCKKYNGQKTNQLANLLFSPPTRNIYHSENFEEAIMLDFEFLKVPCAKRYEQELTERYGNWHEFYRDEGHSAFFDTDKSYTDYTGA